jgi:hypothetical protein
MIKAQRLYPKINKDYLFNAVTLVLERNLSWRRGMMKGVKFIFIALMLTINLHILLNLGYAQTQKALRHHLGRV